MDDPEVLEQEEQGLILPKANTKRMDVQSWGNNLFFFMRKVTLSVPEILQELITTTCIQIALSGQCEPIESCCIDPEWKPRSIQLLSEG